MKNKSLKENESKEERNRKEKGRTDDRNITTVCLIILQRSFNFSFTGEFRTPLQNVLKLVNRLQLVPGLRTRETIINYPIRPHPVVPS